MDVFNYALITLVNVFMVACRQLRIKTLLSPY